MTVTDATAGTPGPDTSPERMAARMFLTAGRLLRSVRRPDPGGLGNGALSALATLAASGPMRLGDLACSEQVAAPTMTRVVTALTDAGYAATEPDRADRRARLVRATAEGRTVVTGRHTAGIAELRHRYEQLAPEDQELLHAAIPVLERLVEPA